MIRIELTINQKIYLLKVLNKIKTYRTKEFESGEITQARLDIDLDIVNDLINAVNGKFREDYMMKSYEARTSSQEKKTKKDMPSTYVPYIIPKEEN